MNKIKIDVPESILIYVDDGRWQSPSLEIFKNKLENYLIDDEKIFIHLIPYFCDYIEIVKIISNKYSIFFNKNIKNFYIESLIQNKKDVFSYLLKNHSIDYSLLPIKNILMKCVYNYLNSYSSEDYFFILEWCFEQAILQNIILEFSNDDFIKLSLYKENKKFENEISYIENKLNISNF